MRASERKATVYNLRKVWEVRFCILTDRQLRVGRGLLIRHFELRQYVITLDTSGQGRRNSQYSGRYRRLHPNRLSERWRIANYRPAGAHMFAAGGGTGKTYSAQVSWPHWAGWRIFSRRRQDVQSTNELRAAGS